MADKLIVLTFDDGPSNVTSDVLDILETNGIPGTFFLIGNNITPENISIMKRQVAMGCEICNHSLTHSDMTTLSADTIREEILETSRRITDAIGIEPKFFRPPFISVNSVMYENIDLPFICGVDSLDWDSNTTVEQRVENVISGAKDGAIILMHDFTDNTQTVRAFPEIIRVLRDSGYEFVTLSELFCRKGVDPYSFLHTEKIWSYC